MSKAINISVGPHLECLARGPTDQANGRERVAIDGAS
jgi:hypothetical protein